MISRERITQFVIWAAAFGAAPLRLMAGPTGGHHATPPVQLLVAQLMGYAAISCWLMSLVVLMPGAGADKWLGRKCKRIRLHHLLGLAGLSLVLLHGLALAYHFLPDELVRFFSFPFPMHRRWEVNVGVLAFWGLVATYFATKLRGSPRLWRWLHRGSIVWLVMALAHVYTMGPAWWQAPWLNLYLTFLAGAAIASLMAKFLSPRRSSASRNRSKGSGSSTPC